MARTANIAKFARVIDGLRSERAEAEARIAEIDKIFAQLGIGSAPVKVGAKRGRPAGSGKKAKAGASAGGKRRKRGKFSTTGEASVLGFLKSHDKASAADVNKHWQAEGRGGKADNTLTKLVKDGQLKRFEVKGERGGRYSIV
ncbi:MAG: hypothetical protein NTW19_23110 [Planctomycetota bacterium]|nr:hypothetical protein [Planctomycetota bacterium]